MPGLCYGQSKLGYGVRLGSGNDKKISEVIAGSPAEKAGLKVGDKLTNVNKTNVDGLDNTAVVALLAKRDEATIIFERGGTKKNISLKKAPFVAFGIKCLSGNCDNGKGRAKLPGWASLEFEGTFLNGEPAGECSIYKADGSLWYTGNTVHFFPNGTGKKYEKYNDKTFVAEEGEFKDGFLEFGSVFDYSGQELSHGSYTTDERRRFIGGYKAITYRGKKAYLNCADMLSVDSAGNSKCTGWATICEGEPLTGKPLSHAKYIFERDSLCRE